MSEETVNYLAIILPFLSILTGIVLTIMGFARKNRKYKIIGFLIFVIPALYLGYITWLVIQIGKMD